MEHGTKANVGKVGLEGIPDHRIVWHKRPIRAKVGRAIADHWQTWHKGQYGQKAGRTIEIADHQLWHKGQYCETSRAVIIWHKGQYGQGLVARDRQSFVWYK